MQIKIDTRQISKYTDLMKTIQKVLYSAWGKDKVQFVSAYPKASQDDSIITPIITYRMIRKLPGEFNKNTEIKPRIREVISPGVVLDESLHGEALEVYGQLFDYYIEFQIWTESGEEADATVEKFQEFMFKYTGYLKKLGVNEILFQESNSDISTARWRSELINRNIIYRVRIDEIVGVKCPVVEDVAIGITLDGYTFETEVMVFSNEKTYADGEAILTELEGKIEEFKVTK